MMKRVLSLLAAIGFSAALAYGAQTTYNVVSGSQAMCSYTYGSTTYVNCSVPVEPTSGLPTTGGTAATYLSAASTNSTSVKASAAALLLSVTVINTTTTLGDLRIYNSAGAPTCSSATGLLANIPIQSNAISAGITVPFPGGVYASVGLGFCYTGANTNTDTTNAATGANITLVYN